MIHERTLGDRYRLDRILGEGAMAEVYLAHDLTLDRAVALKILKPSLATDHSLVERFVREARATASLRSAGIVAIYDVGEAEGCPFIVMEYVSDGNLSERLRAGPLSETQALDYAAQIAEALAIVHAGGLVHRDIKAGNIFLQPGGVAKLGDFGVARSSDGDAHTLTQPGMLIGSVAYLAPEVVQGERATYAADLYSLGIVLYQMLTRGLPYEGDSPISVAYKHVSAPLPDFAAQAAIQPDVAALIARLMQKDPATRIASAEQTARLLRGLIAARNTTADAPTMIGQRSLAPPLRRKGSLKLPLLKVPSEWAGTIIYVVVALALTLIAARLIAAPRAQSAVTPRPSPLAGAAQAPGSTMEVPLLVHLPATRAGDLLYRAHLEMKIFQRYAKVPKGTVMAQYPPAGARLPAHASVLLLMSAGKGPIVRFRVDGTPIR